jgi:S-adenosylmethionine hydrolase
MSHMRPIVALLTDFGSQDHYAGAVRGAVLAACREASVVDIAHELPPHDVAVGAFALLVSYRAFPAGTVFLAVVDPGVGSERRGLAIEAGGYRFVGPDNGLFTHVLAEHPGARVHSITNAGLFRAEVSPVFHGRDVFAPVAGQLAAGLEIDAVGPVVFDPVKLDLPGPKPLSPREWEATVLHVDRFGNLTTNLGKDELDAILQNVGGDPTQAVVIVEGVVLPLVRTYADLPEGEGCGLVGSSGRLEVAVCRGNAARKLNAGRGTSVLVRLVPVGG